MDSCCGCGFHLIAANGTVDQCAEVFRRDAGLFDGFANGFNADGTGQSAGIIEAAFFDARHQFQTTVRKSQAFVDRCEFLFDVFGGDDVRWRVVNNRFDADAVVSHGVWKKEKALCRLQSA